LKAEYEKSRSYFETIIDEKEDVIKRLTQTTLQQESTIMRLSNDLRRLQDVEDQLRVSRHHEALMR